MAYTASFDFALFGTPGTAGYHARKAQFLTALNNELQRLWADLSNGGGMQFASRAQAVARGQSNITAEFRMITVMESGVITYRTPNSTEDPLFPDATPYWGVVKRVDPFSIVRDTGVIALTGIAGTADAITASMPLGASDQNFTAGKLVRLVPVADATIASATLTVAGVTRTIRDADLSAFPAPFLKAGRSYIFETYGSGILRLVSATETSSERAAQISASAVIGLANVAGTSDAITAEFPAALVGQSFVAGKLVRLVPVADATIASATITVAGVTRTIRDADLSVFTAPFLKAGRVYLFETYGSVLLRLVSAPQTEAERNSWEAGTDAKIEVLEDAPAYADGSRALLRFGGRDILRMYPDGPRLSGPVLETWQPTGNRGIAATDQFETVGGVRYPTALINSVSRKALIFSVYGQSNGDVTEMDDPLIWRAPPMPDHILTLNDVSGARGGLRGYIGVPAPTGPKRLVPAREDAVLVSGKYVQSYATAAAARLNALVGAPYRAFAVRASANGGQRLVGTSVGQGLWKDSAGAYVQSWLNWTADLKYMHDLLLAQGYEVEAVHLCFTHQEADWETPRATYASQFAGMKAERETLLATDMPGIPVRWFCDQASGSGLRSPGYRGGAWQSRLAIIDAVEAEPNMTMVMPRYPMRFGFNGGARETIHHAHYDRILQGETYAHAMREVMEGRAWRCPRMTAATVSGNAITVTFDSLLPIVIDPTFCKVRPDMGFKIGDGSIAVQSVTQTGQRQVTIQCSGSPVGQLLAYAWREQDAQDVSDEWPIATGAIRDAFEAPSLFLSGERILRPALGYTLQL